MGTAAEIHLTRSRGQRRINTKPIQKSTREVGLVKFDVDSGLILD
jgi:hypothetical protein